MLRQSQSFPLQPLPRLVYHIVCMSLWLSIHRVAGGATGDIFPAIEAAQRKCPGEHKQDSWLVSASGQRTGSTRCSCVPHPASPCCLSAFLAVEISSSCSGLPRGWGISLPLKVCSCLQPAAAGAMGGVVLAEPRCHAGPFPRACDPDPRGNSLPPTNSLSYLCTAAAHKWASRDGKLRQLFRVEKHVKTCLDGLPARQTPVSPRLIHSLACQPDHLQQERRALPQPQEPWAGWSLTPPRSPWSKAVPRAPCLATGTRVWGTSEARAQPEHHDSPWWTRRHSCIHPWLSCAH